MSQLTSDITLKKPLPSALEEERVILGVIQLDNTVFPQANAVLLPEDFSAPSNRKIYEAIRRLWERGEGIDPLTIADELERSGELHQIGGPAYISSLTDGVPRYSNIENYVRIVKRKSAQRQLIAESNVVMEAAFEDSEDPEVIAARANDKFTAVSTASSSLMKSREMGELMNQAFGHQVHRRTTPTGFDLNDSLLLGGGLGVGTLTIIAARTNEGKSTAALQIASNVADRFDMHGDLSDREVVLFFGLEMEGQEIAHRAAVVRAELPWSQVQQGMFLPPEMARLNHIRARAQHWQMRVHDISRLNEMDIARECRAVRRHYGRLDLVVVDYLGLLRSSQKHKDRQETVAYLMSELKIMSREVGIEAPFIVPVQINRVGANAEAITLEHLREAGAVEESADKVCIIQRPGKKFDSADKRGYNTRWVWAKQRMGPKGSVGMFFDGNFGGFSEIPKSKVIGLKQEELEDDEY